MNQNDVTVPAPFTIAKTVHSVEIAVRFRHAPRVYVGPQLYLVPVDAVFRYQDGRLDPGHSVTVRGRLQLHDGTPFGRRGASTNLRAKSLRFEDEPWLMEVKRELDAAYAVDRSALSV